MDVVWTWLKRILEIGLLEFLRKIGWKALAWLVLGVVGLVGVILVLVLILIALLV